MSFDTRTSPVCLGTREQIHVSVLRVVDPLWRRDRSRSGPAFSRFTVIQDQNLTSDSPNPLRFDGLSSLLVSSSLFLFCFFDRWFLLGRYVLRSCDSLYVTIGWLLLVLYLREVILFEVPWLWIFFTLILWVSLLITSSYVISFFLQYFGFIRLYFVSLHFFLFKL